MKLYFFLIGLLPFVLLAQTGGEMEFKIKKPAAARIYLVPNYDTLSSGNDTLVSGKRYYFTLVGIDSASIAKVDFGTSSCRIRSGNGNTAILDVIPVSYVKGTSADAPIGLPLIIYRKNRTEGEVCFTTMFVVKKRTYVPQRGANRMRWSGILRRG